MDSIVLERLERLESKLQIFKVGFLITFLLLAATLAAVFFGFPAKADDGILRAKGLVINDEQGRPRIVMGAPAPKVKGRTRSDELTGIVYLDENGADRLTFGKEPDPMTAEGVKPRRVGGAGILIHDKQGIERGGYSVLDDETAALTVDYPKTGEAVALSANNMFSAIGLFHRSELGVYREALTFGVIRKNNQSFLKITDTNNTQRLRIQTNDNQKTEIKSYDKDSKEISSKFIN